MDIKQQIIEAMNSPEELESLYRQNPEEFTHAFPDVFSQYPDSLILQVWHQRLSYQPALESEAKQPTLGYRMSIAVFVKRKTYHFNIRKPTTWGMQRIIFTTKNRPINRKKTTCLC